MRSKAKKAKPKAKVLKKKPVRKSPSKVKRKTKVKPKAKTSTKKPKLAKLKPVKTAKSKPKAKNHPANSHFNDQQKSEFLTIIEQLVSLHRHERDGLRSLDGVDRILDKYNQHFPTSNEKFDAIVKYGMEKNAALTNHTVSIAIDSRRFDENQLYTLLQSIWDGKTNYKSAIDEINDIYHNAKEYKMKKHLERH